jgi:2-desacetyl-2-hydroxyethyl bacteriochlorophyllide A dehydrogenase
MLAVTFQAPGEVRVEERPEPEPREPTDAVVQIHATGVCGSDLHIYHGRHPVEPGFTLGHEFVGEVLATGDDVTGVAPGDRVIGCFLAACGLCWFCQRRLFHLCESLRIFGHGEISGGLQGSQAEQVLVPNADLVLRRAPEALPDDAALFAGDVMNTGFHAIRSAGLQEGQSVAVLGLGPVGLCAVQAARHAGAAQVIAVDTVAERLETAEHFGAQPVHLTDQDPRAEVKAATEGRGVDVCVEAVGHEQALDLAVRLTRKAGTVSTVGVHGERCQVHMGLLWNKGLVLKAGVANVIANVDEVLGLLSSGALDPTPLVTHHMKLEDAPEAYAVYDRREALKIVLSPPGSG